MPPRPAPPSAPAPAAARPSPRRPGDWMWHGLGGGVAAASAGFAAYALAFSTGEVVPSGNFSVFNGYDRLYRAAAAQHAPPPGPRRTEVAGRGGVDFDPTGAVPAGRGGAPGAGGVPSAGPDGPALPGYTLRDVFDGKALVESRSTLAVVKPGSVLEGAGEILAIENRGDHWVVLTRGGFIAGQRR